MSIALMTKAWKTTLNPAQKLALLAMCDWANDDGDSLHPSIRAIAERVGMSERHAKRIVHELINDGWLYVTGNLFGGAPGASRKYRINLEKLSSTGDTHVTRRGDTCVTGDKSSRVTNKAQTGDKCDTRRVTNEAQTGDTHVTQPTIEPSVEPPEIRQGATRAHATRATRLHDDWTLPADWHSWALQEQPTWTPEHAGKVSESFADYWRARPDNGAVKRDWCATWRNWVRREGPMKASVTQLQPLPTSDLCDCGKRGTMKLGGKWFCDAHVPQRRAHAAAA